MSLATNQCRVVAPSGQFFTGTLAQNDGLAARIPLPAGVGAGGTARSVIQTLQIVSADQLDWELWFFANKLFQSAGHPDLEVFCGLWAFSVAAGDGRQIGAAGLYHYYIDGLGIQYQDLDMQPDRSQTAYLNVVLVNRSAGAKTDGAWFQATFGMLPTIGLY